MALTDYYSQAIDAIAANNSSLISQQQLLKTILAAHVPAFDGLTTDGLTASNFSMQSLKIGADFNALYNAYNDLITNSSSVLSNLQTTIRSSYFTSTVLTTYYAAIKSFVQMGSYYTNMFVPTVRNVTSVSNAEIIGTVVNNIPDVLSSATVSSIEADCNSYISGNNAYLYNYTEHPLSAYEAHNLTVNFNFSNVSFIMFESFTSNVKVTGVSYYSGSALMPLASSAYSVQYIGTYVRVYLNTPVETSSIVLTLSTYLPQSMPQSEAIKVNAMNKPISSLTVEDMYLTAKDVSTLTGNTAVYDYMRGIGVVFADSLSSFTFYDVSNIMVGYAEFNNPAVVNYAFGANIYGIRIFPSFPTITVNGTVGSCTMTTQLAANTLQVTVPAPSNIYVPQNIGYVFALYR